MLFQLGSALLEACVLAIVSEEDTYGYAITQTVQMMFTISESSLYPVLRRLQKEGHLSTYDKPYQGRNRRYYAITEIGQKRLAQSMAEWDIYKNKVDEILKGGDTDV